MYRHSLLWLLLLTLIPATSFALSGSSACNELERRLTELGVTAECNYPPMAGGYNYVVVVYQTDLSVRATIGNISAGILGADAYVPTKSEGLAISFLSKIYMWRMASARQCKSQVNNDQAFERCMIERSTVTVP